MILVGLGRGCVSCWELLVGSDGVYERNKQTKSFFDSSGTSLWQPSTTTDRERERERPPCFHLFSLPNYSSSSRPLCRLRRASCGHCCGPLQTYHKWNIPGFVELWLDQTRLRKVFHAQSTDRSECTKAGNRERDARHSEMAASLAWFVQAQGGASRRWVASYILLYLSDKQLGAWQSSTNRRGSTRNEPDHRQSKEGRGDSCKSQWDHSLRSSVVVAHWWLRTASWLLHPRQGLKTLGKGNAHWLGKSLPGP